MHPAAAPLFDALRERGDGPLLREDERVVSASAVLRGIEAAHEKASKTLAPGDIVAMRGRHPVLRVYGPLAAWLMGLCTQLLSEREPAASADALLAASGARWLFGWRETGVYESVDLKPERKIELLPGTLLATSGSAGHPKLVAHALEQHIASARGACAFLDLGPDDRLLLSLPTYHAGGLGIVLRALLSGALLCVPGLRSTLTEALAHHRPTQVSLVATQLARLLDDESATASLRACRTVLLGGGPVPGRLRARALAAGVPLAVGYGATETSAFITAGRDPDVVRRAQSAGRPLPGRDVRIDDAGEIRVGGPTLFSGYLVDGQLDAARDADGLWATGDRGRIEDGVLYVTGRTDRMFISGGENVQPEEIEAALLELEGVADAVVVARTDAEYGARPVALVAGEGLDRATLDTALRAVLPGFKTPDAYYRMPAVEKRMKPDLRVLEALVEAPDGLKPL